jgi:hypothetical protein
VFDEIPQPEKVLKRHQNRDDPCIMAWDHYIFSKTREKNGSFLFLGKLGTLCAETSTRLTNSQAISRT